MLNHTIDFVTKLKLNVLTRMEAFPKSDIKSVIKSDISVKNDYIDKACLLKQNISALYNNPYLRTQLSKKIRPKATTRGPLMVWFLERRKIHQIK